MEQLKRALAICRTYQFAFLQGNINFQFVILLLHNTWGPMKILNGGAPLKKLAGG